MLQVDENGSWTVCIYITCEKKSSMNAMYMIAVFGYFNARGLGAILVCKEYYKCSAWKGGSNKLCMYVNMKA